MTHKRSFEPPVMFFGLINSLVTFQAMMNELLRCQAQFTLEWEYTE